MEKENRGDIKSRVSLIMEKNQTSTTAKNNPQTHTNKTLFLPKLA